LEHKVSELRLSPSGALYFVIGALFTRLQALNFVLQLSAFVLRLSELLRQMCRFCLCLRSGFESVLESAGFGGFLRFRSERILKKAAKKTRAAPF
jgi:hypothetical protein